MTVTLDGYAPEVRTVQVASGGETRVDVALHALPATLAISCQCPGARVDVDAKPVGLVPLGKPIEVPAGKHVIEVTSSGFQRWTRTVDVRAGASVSVDVVLSTPPPAAPQKRYQRVLVPKSTTSWPRGR